MFLEIVALDANFGLRGIGLVRSPPCVGGRKRMAAASAVSGRDAVGFGPLTGVGGKGAGVDVRRAAGASGAARGGGGADGGGLGTCTWVTTGGVGVVGAPDWATAVAAVPVNNVATNAAATLMDVMVLPSRCSCMSCSS